MLSMAVLTGIADLITVFIHCCHGKMVARLTSLVTKIRAVMGFLQAVASGSSAGFFKSAQSMSGGKDVWSWTCANADDAMAAASSAGSICNTNVCILPLPFFPWKDFMKKDLAYQFFIRPVGCVHVASPTDCSSRSLACYRRLRAFEARDEV